VYWEGEGIAVGNFYKTHDKIATVKSNDAGVITEGFKMPESIPASEGVEAKEVTPQEKLEAFKVFLQSNASVFGITYDPVDRRPDEFKFPSKYDEAAFTTFSKTILENTLKDVAASVQSNVIDKMIKDKHIAEGSVLAFGIGDGIVSATEKYNSGSLKYATATYPVTLDVAGKNTVVNVEVSLVSGQLKKPRDFGSVAFTMTGIKNTLVEAGILPKIEKPTAEETPAPQENAGCESGDSAQ
jgi:hypothetical protein